MYWIGKNKGYYSSKKKYRKSSQNFLLKVKNVVNMDKISKNLINFEQAG